MIGNDDPFVTCGKVFGFTSHAEQMAFIVKIVFSFGSEEESTVIKLSVISGYIASTDSQLK